MAGPRNGSRRLSKRFIAAVAECEHRCFAPKGADGPCTKCGCAMFWVDNDWVPVVTGDVNLSGVARYAHFSMQDLTMNLDPDLEGLIWPQRGQVLCD